MQMADRVGLAITLLCVILVVNRRPSYEEMEALLRVYCAKPPAEQTQKQRPVFKLKLEV